MPDFIIMAVAVLLLTRVAAGAGAAILAAEGCGKNLGSLECTRSFVPSDRAEYYNEKYKQFKALEKKLWQEGNL